MKQVLGIKNDAARMKVTPPLAVAPLAQEDDMRWNPNDDRFSSSISWRNLINRNPPQTAPRFCTTHHSSKAVSARLPCYDFAVP